MKALRAFYGSSIGKKWVVALTGLVLVGYVIGHLLGNLQVFLGPEQINAYAHKLHEFGPLLWIVRIFLLGAFILHIVATVQLVIENRAARPAPYAVKKNVKATTASRTMAISGAIVLCFIIYHLLHFTVQVTNPEFRELRDPGGHPDVYAMIIRGFLNPFATLFYIAGVVLLCLHLSHGFSSFMQTVGANTGGLVSPIARGGRILAWVICAGYLSIPLAVLFRVLRLRTGQ